MCRFLRSQCGPSVPKSVLTRSLFLSAIPSILIFGSCVAMLRAALPLAAGATHLSIARSNNCERGTLRFIAPRPDTVIRMAQDQRGGY